MRGRSHPWRRILSFGDDGVEGVAGAGVTGSEPGAAVVGAGAGVVAPGAVVAERGAAAFVSSFGPQPASSVRARALVAA